MFTPPRSEKEKMLSGELYNGLDPELVVARAAATVALQEYNATIDEPKRRLQLASLLGFVGEDAVIRSPFYCDYGSNIRLGRGAFLNFGCVLLDVNLIEIGDLTQIGPHVQIYAADHPRDPEARRRNLESGKPVRIGQNVWIGGGAILLPGITVGDDAIIGAGSVVTRDVPAGATVAGNPARRLHP